MLRPLSSTRRVQVQSIKMKEHRILSGNGSVELYVRCKTTNARGKKGKPLIFVHGATYPGSAVFDWPMFGEPSWLDYMALDGFDSYLFDIRGYGRSRYFDTDESRPLARTSEAIEDLNSVVALAMEQTGSTTVDLVGWSWGTAICGAYAADHPQKVRHLVLNAPLWVIPQGSTMALTSWIMSTIPQSSRLLGAYRTVSKSEVYRRWTSGVSPNTVDELIPRSEFDTWWDAMVASGPFVSESLHRAPSGVIADLLQFWGMGKPTYDPQLIRCPTLLTLGEWDRDTPPHMAIELLSQLSSTPYKRLELLGRGTHAMVLEVNRLDLYRQTRDFLNAIYE